MRDGGACGVGKTRLLNHFAESADALGRSALRARGNRRANALRGCAQSFRSHRDPRRREGAGHVLQGPVALAEPVSGMGRLPTNSVSLWCSGKQLVIKKMAH
jgi:hypothetical protein